MIEYVTVARLADVAPGSGISVPVNGRTVAVFNVDGTFHALDGTCLHRGGPVGEGDLEGTVVTCPWHGWQYEVTTGANVFDPEIGLQSLPVRIEGDEVQVAVA